MEPNHMPCTDVVVVAVIRDAMTVGFYCHYWQRMRNSTMTTYSLDHWHSQIIVIPRHSHRHPLYHHSDSWHVHSCWRRHPMDEVESERAFRPSHCRHADTR